MNAPQQHVFTLLQDEPDARAVARLDSLKDQAWQEIISEAEALGVSALLSRCVDRLQIPVTPLIRQQLLAIVQNHTARNLRLLREFGILARALDEQGIAFMPFKGVHLCTALYKNIGERPIWDIDLLIRLEEIRPALNVIEGTGYRSSRPYDLEMEVRNYHHLPAYIKRGAPPLEIHWTLLNPRFKNGLNWEELWERSVPAQVGEVEVRVFSPADLLIYLCAHVAYQHIYIDSVRSLYDIKLLALRMSDQLDWGAITARARTWGLANSMYLTLRLTDYLLGCPLPDVLTQVLRSAEFSERIFQAALARVLEHSDSSPVISAVWSRRNLFQRFKGLWGRLILPRAVLAGRYRLPPGSRKVYLYYFVRARDLLRMYGRDLWDLLRGKRKKREMAVSENELIAYLKWW